MSENTVNTSQVLGTASQYVENQDFDFSDFQEYQEDPFGKLNEEIGEALESILSFYDIENLDAELMSGLLNVLIPEMTEKFEEEFAEFEDEGSSSSSSSSSYDSDSSSYNSDSDSDSSSDDIVPGSEEDNYGHHHVGSGDLDARGIDTATFNNKVDDLDSSDPLYTDAMETIGELQEEAANFPDGPLKDAIMNADGPKDLPEILELLQLYSGIFEKEIEELKNNPPADMTDEEVEEAIASLEEQKEVFDSMAGDVSDDIENIMQSNPTSDTDSTSGTSSTSGPGSEFFDDDNNTSSGSGSGGSTTMDDYKSDMQDLMETLGPMKPELMNDIFNATGIDDLNEIKDDLQKELEHNERLVGNLENEIAELEDSGAPQEEIDAKKEELAYREGRVELFNEAIELTDKAISDIEEEESDPIENWGNVMDERLGQALEDGLDISNDLQSMINNAKTPGDLNNLADEIENKAIPENAEAIREKKDEIADLEPGTDEYDAAAEELDKLEQKEEFLTETMRFARETAREMEAQEPTDDEIIESTQAMLELANLDVPEDSGIDTTELQSLIENIETGDDLLEVAEEMEDLLEEIEELHAEKIEELEEKEEQYGDNPTEEEQQELQDLRDDIRHLGRNMDDYSTTINIVNANQSKLSDE